MKQKVLDIWEEAQSAGITQKDFCELICLCRRRLRRWCRRDDLEDAKPGYAPGTAPHRLRSEEKEAILKIAKKEEDSDKPHRVLAYEALDDKEAVTASPSSFYRVMRDENLTERRGKSGTSGKGEEPPREEIDGPLQRICWDISYIRTYQKYRHFYLYTVLDEWSRKVLAWSIKPNRKKIHAEEMLNELYFKEDLMEKSEEDLPVVINDNGGQMKAKSVQQMFEDMGIDQFFTRPHTPNDNPFVEALFKTVKYNPEYPGKFRTIQEAEDYFDLYFNWYNTEHLHSGIGHITPNDKHNGLAESILKMREKRLKEAHRQRIRKHKNRQKANIEKKREKYLENQEIELECVVVA